MHRCVFAVEKPPTAHQRRGRVAPRRRRVVAVTVAWEIHHVSVYRRCGKHRVLIDKSVIMHMSRDKNAERAFLSVLRFIVPLPPVFCSKEAHRFRCASRCVMWFGSGAAIYRSYHASVLSCAQTQKYMMPSAAYSSSHDLISRADGWISPAIMGVSRRPVAVES